MPIVGYSDPSAKAWPGSPYYASEPPGLGLLDMEMGKDKMMCAALGAGIGWLVFGRVGALVGGVGGWILCGGYPMAKIQAKTTTSPPGSNGFAPKPGPIAF